MHRTTTKTGKSALAIAAVVVIVILPGLNAFTPPGTVLHVSNFSINLYGKYLCYAILAISVDLLWGYTGLLSLGQALFFSLGGYMLGMYLMLKIGKLGQYYLSGNNPNLLPDFMVFLGHKFLPWFWRPFYSFGFAMSMIVLVPGLLSLV